jgi:hypothetical protein
MKLVEFPGGWFLRGTVATGDRDRATRYATAEAAEAALATARKFLKPAAIKAAKIVEG